MCYNCQQFSYRELEGFTQPVGSAWGRGNWPEMLPWNPDCSTISSVQLQTTICDPMDCSTPGLPLHHQLPEFTQTHVHWVGVAIQPSHPLLSPSPPTFNLSQHQGLFQWVSSLYQVAKALEFQLQHHSFQWTPRTDLLYDGLVLGIAYICEWEIRLLFSF